MSCFKMDPNHFMNEKIWQLSVMAGTQCQWPRQSRFSPMCVLDQWCSTFLAGGPDPGGGPESAWPQPDPTEGNGASCGPMQGGRVEGLSRGGMAWLQSSYGGTWCLGIWQQRRVALLTGTAPLPQNLLTLWEPHNSKGCIWPAGQRFSIPVLENYIQRSWYHWI